MHFSKMKKGIYNFIPLIFMGKILILKSIFILYIHILL